MDQSQVESVDEQAVLDTKPDETRISKHQMKRKAKLEAILKNRAEKRKIERERNKLKRKMKQAAAAAAAASSATVSAESQTTPYAENTELKQTRKSLKKNKMCDSANKLKVCIDCSFESLMSISDLNHLSKQIAFCYAANRRLKQPLQFYMTDYKGVCQFGGSSFARCSTIN
jgi:hypothetical protein